MLLTAFDVDPGAATRTVELQHGDLFDLGIRCDVLVISARRGVYTPVAGTLIESVEQACRLEIAGLPRELDLSVSPVGAWCSTDLTPMLRWPRNSSTRFSRIAVVESNHDADAHGPWSVFNQLFSLLALLPLQGVHCQVVATPLLTAGNQGVDPVRLFPALVKRCREGFRHAPDLERLIVFDRKRGALEHLGEEIDRELGRCPGAHDLIDLSAAADSTTQLRALLEGFSQIHPDFINDPDLRELLHLLSESGLTAIGLGMHSRRLVERLVRARLGWSQASLYQGIQDLARCGMDPWLVSCLHQVRVFGNWMGHPTRPGQRRTVSRSDVTALLAALIRVVEDYPW